MEWIGIEWIGLEWNGLEWNGMDCYYMYFLSLHLDFRFGCHQKDNNIDLICDVDRANSLTIRKYH